MQRILEQLGYLKSESLVYASLLRLGQCSAGAIAKETGLNRVSVYKALEKLIRNGLISYVIRANRKTFRTANPDKVRQIIDEKRKQLITLERKIPGLIELYNKKRKDKIQSDIYEGVKGLRTILEEFLKSAKKNDEWLVLGGPKKAEILGGIFKSLNKRRAQKGVKFKIIYNQDAKSMIDVRKKQPLTEIRTMPENYITPASIEILNNRVAIILYSSEIIIFSTDSKELSDSFRHYFNLIWKNSEKA